MSEGRKDSDGRTGQMDRRQTGKIEKHVPPDKSGIAVDNTQNGDTNRDGGEARKAPDGETTVKHQRQNNNQMMTEQSG